MRTLRGGSRPRHLALRHSGRVEIGDGLRHQSYALAAPGRLFFGRERLAVKQHGGADFGRARQNAQHSMRQQAFACAAGADQGHQFAPLHTTAHAIEHRQPFALQQRAIARKAQVHVLNIKHRRAFSNGLSREERNGGKPVRAGAGWGAGLPALGMCSGEPHKTDETTKICFIPAPVGDPTPGASPMPLART